MNIMIIGCNRTGTLLARFLQQAGHELAIIDASAARLSALAREGWFRGLSHCGRPIDIDTLAAGGIESCEAVFALTEQDTVNIMVAQIAQQQYHIKRVWACIEDPVLKDAYGRSFSIWTVCPGQLAADALYHSFLAVEGEQQLAFGNDMVHFYPTVPPKTLVGMSLVAAAMAMAGKGHTLLGVVRAGGEVVLAGVAEAVVQATDQLLLAETAPGPAQAQKGGEPV